MESNYTFMSTGLGASPARPLDEDFVRKLLALVYTMVKNSAVTAATYTEHAKRARVTKADVIMALKYEARRFLHYENLETDVANSEQELGEDDGASDSESWESASDASVEKEGDPAQNECPCSICDGVRSAVSTWADWAPENEAEAFLRNHVEKVCTM